MIPQCNAEYRRPDGTLVYCTYLRDHPSEKHSFDTMQQQDEHDAGKLDITDVQVQIFIDALAEGLLDPYIEAILSTGHARKHVLRGVRGFPGPTVPAPRVADGIVVRRR